MSVGFALLRRHTGAKELVSIWSRQTKTKGLHFQTVVVRWQGSRLERTRC
jgi:hypothetical protein